MNPIYCKYSNDRDGKFQIKTTIATDENGNKSVYKYAGTPAAIPHIQRIYRHYQEMCESYEDTILTANRCEQGEDYVRLEFVEGNTLEDYLDELYLEGKYLELIEKIKEYRDILYGLKDNIPFSYTTEFENVFGKETNFVNCKSLKISNVDLIFGNILLNDKWTVIDYEWTFDFPVPIDYIIYRSVYYYVHGSTKRDALTNMGIFRMMGISEEDMLLYAKMERNFQRYVAGEKATLAQMKETMLKRCEKVFDEGRAVSIDYLQLYFNSGKGYTEEESVKKNYNYGEKVIEFETRISGKVQQVRIDPATQPVLVGNLEIFLNDHKVDIEYTNGIEFGEELLAFGNDNPQIITEKLAQEGTLFIRFTVSPANKKNVDSLRTQRLQMMQMQSQQKQQHREIEHLVQENARLNVENNAKGEYLDNLRRKKVWRFLSLSKRTLRSLKHDGIVKTGKKGVHKVQNKLRGIAPEAVAVQQETVQLPSLKPITGKKKILVVVHEAQKGGATLLSLNIVKTLKSITEYEPIVLLLAGGPLEEEFKKQAVCYDLHQPDFSKVYEPEKLDGIIRQIAELDIHYALCNSVVTGIVLEALNGIGVRNIVMVHELPTSIYAYDFVLAAQAVQQYAEHVVFPAEFVKQKFLAKFPIEEEKCHVMPQGVFSNFNSYSIKEKQNNKKKLCEELGIEPDTRIVLGCGYGNFRKGLDWFGRIAISEMKRNPKVDFLWLGDREKEFYEWISNDLEVENLTDRFHWMGYTENAGYVFGGADLFLLTSREDPFPCVVQDAMKQYTPVFAFDSAGGIPEILEQGRGVVVPYGDCDACVEKIEQLLEDRKLYEEIAEKAKGYINEETPARYLSRLLNLLCPGEELFRKLPDLKVSVIIPNYNYEAYIPERLFCILNQSVKPYEIIFLDDVSKDNSVAVAREILENSGIRYKIVENETNQGCFKQWLNGIHHAEGDIIWIAEADDACELDFIERLLPFFEDDQVNLAYAQSEVIDENNRHSGFIYTEYTKDLSEDKWNQDYVNNGEAEIIDGLGIKNTIPNASGVLMRKSALEGMDEYLKDYAISGDWFAYVYAIRVGKIAFCSDVLNYHRRHSTSIIYQREQDVKLFEELLSIKLYMAENFMIPESIRERFVNHVRNEYGRLMSENAPKFEEQKELVETQKKMEDIINNRLERYSYLKNVPKRKLLFVMPDFEMGGGQTLVIRLANYFSKFHEVYVYNARPWLVEERIVKMFAQRVHVLESNGDPNQLREYVKQYGIETINCHIWWSDKITYQAVKDMDTKVVLSMHGCYEALLQNPDWDVDFEKMSVDILNRADEIIYATDKNKKIFEKVEVSEKIHQIYYGYELESIPRKQRETLKIDEDSFVYGLVARGIQQKGFGEAVEAFKLLKEKTDKKIDLILIGNGPFIDELKEKNQGVEHVHFVDNLQKPSEWIGWVKTFDCALLPTYYISESLPNSVIEYLAYEKPVISTDIGDIKYMLVNDNAEAGIVLKLHDNGVDAGELSEAMEKMLRDTAAYQHYKEGTKELFGQFDIRNFAENYYTQY